MTGVPAPKHCEGDSIKRLVEQPQAAWDRPVVTTHGYKNHAVRSDRYRYIRYADGSEELYDHEADPREWTNLAAREEMKTVKDELARWLPKTDREEGPRAGERKGPRRRAAQAISAAELPQNVRDYFAREWYGEFDRN